MLVIVLLVIFAVGFLSSWGLTLLVRRNAGQLGLLDEPNDERKIHRTAMPTSGGIGMAGGMATALLFVVWLHPAPFTGIGNTTILVGAGALLMLAVGIIDDLHVIGAKKKFFIQLSAAYLLLHAGFRIDLMHLPFVDGDPYTMALYSMPLTLIWVVGVINAVNLIDGLDGLASGVVAIAFVMFGVIYGVQGHGQLLVYSVIVVGAIAGFLVHNFNPASIFMGDSGSLLIGYLLAVFSLAAPAHADLTMALLVPVVVLGLPVLDTSTSIVRRMLAGRAIFAPDRGHVHHRLMQHSTVRATVLTLYVAAAWFGGAALLMSLLPAWWAFAVGLATGVVALLWIYALGCFSTEPAGITGDGAMEEIEAQRVNGSSRQEQYIEDYMGDTTLQSDRRLHGNGSEKNHAETSMLDKQVVITAELEVVELDGELVVLNVGNGHYYGLNQTGAFILEMAKERRTLEEVVSALCERYNEEASELRGDVRTFIGEMEGYGMLSLEEARAA